MRFPSDSNIVVESDLSILGQWSIFAQERFSGVLRQPCNGASLRTGALFSIEIGTKIPGFPHPSNFRAALDPTPETARRGGADFYGLATPDRWAGG